jgi:hypothetical protein
VSVLGAPTAEFARGLAEQVRDFLRYLAARLDHELPLALTRAVSAWDHFDAVCLLDGVAERSATELRLGCTHLLGSEDASLRARGIEIALTVDTASRLVRLIERRLAALVRLRSRASDDALLPEGRPFLDLAAALEETARLWA